MANELAPWDNPAATQTPTEVAPWEQPAPTPTVQVQPTPVVQPQPIDPQPMLGGAGGGIIQRLQAKPNSDNIAPSVRIANQIISGAQEGFGNDTLGLSPESQHMMIKLGIFPDPNGEINGLQLFNSNLINGFAKIGDATIRSINAAVVAAAKGAGAVAGEVEGAAGKTQSFTNSSAYNISRAASGETIFTPKANPPVTVTKPVTFDESVSNEAQNFINWAMISNIADGGAAMEMYKPAITRDGIPHALNLGRSLVDGESTRQAAQVLGNVSYDKVLSDLYQNYGLLPSEVVHDAQHVPSILPDIATGNPVAAYGIVDPKFDQLIKDISTKQHVAAGNAPPGVDVSFPDPYGSGEITGKIQSYGQGLPGGKFDPNHVKILADNGAVYEGPIDVLNAKVVPKEGVPGVPSPVTNPTEYMLSTMSIGEPDKKQSLTWDQIYSRVLDDTNPYNAFVRDAIKRGVNPKDIVNDPQALVRVMKGINGRIDEFLTGNTRGWNGEITGESLQNILQPSGGEKLNLDNVRALWKAERAVELEGQGISTGLDMNKVQAVISDLGPQYGSITKRLTEYNNRLLDYVEKSGLYDAKTIAEIKAKSAQYSPFYSAFEDTGDFIGKPVGLDPYQPLKEIVNPGGKTIDPLESTIKRSYTLITAADKNGIAQSIADIIDMTNDAGHPVGSRVKRAGDNTITVFRDGVKQYYQVNDPELLRAWQGLDRDSSALLRNVLISGPASTLRAGVTLDPAFAFRNLIRDMTTAFLNTGSGLWQPLKTANGLFSLLTKDEKFHDWLFSGGMSADIASMDRNYLQENLFKLHTQTGFANAGWNVLHQANPLTYLRAYSAAIENSTRLGEYISEDAARQAAGIPLDRVSRTAMGLASRDITLDFSRAGSAIRAPNAAIAFLNANLQDPDKIVRMFKKDPAGFTLKAIAGITIPTILAWAHNHDDPRYKGLDRSVKDMNFIWLTDHWRDATDEEYGAAANVLPQRIGPNGQKQINDGAVVKIPGPFNMKILFGAIPERLLNAYADHDPNAAKGLSTSIIQSMIPGVAPTAAIPTIEQWANRSTFTGQKLIPDSLLQQLPEYQYNDYTTDTAKLIGRTLGSLPPISKMNQSGNPISTAMSSPILIQNYINDWTGGIGQYLLRVSDYGLRKSGIVPDISKPTPTLADNPFVHGFFVRYPSGSDQRIQDFYDNQTAHKMLVDTLKAQAKNGNVQATEDILNKYGMVYSLDNVNKVLAESQQVIHNIYRNPEMSPEEKRQQIDVLYYRMIQVAAMGNQIYTNLDEQIAKEKAR